MPSFPRLSVFDNVALAAQSRRRRQPPPPRAANAASASRTSCHPPRRHPRLGATSALLEIAMGLALDPSCSSSSTSPLQASPPARSMPSSSLAREIAAQRHPSSHRAQHGRGHAARPWHRCSESYVTVCRSGTSTRARAPIGRPRRRISSTLASRAWRARACAHARPRARNERGGAKRTTNFIHGRCHRLLVILRFTIFHSIPSRRPRPLRPRASAPAAPAAPPALQGPRPRPRAPAWPWRGRRACGRANPRRRGLIGTSAIDDGEKGGVGRGLAGAVAAHQAEDLAGGDGEGKAAQNPDRP